MFDWFAKTSASPIAEGFTTRHDMVATGHPGFIVGTLVATAQGWRAVEELAPGDMVLTFDNGMRPIQGIRRETQFIDDRCENANMSAVYVPREAFGNRSPLWLRAEQGVMIEHDLLVDTLGDPFAIVPACALEGYHGISRAPMQVSMELVTLSFDEDEVVYIEAGLLAFCPAQMDAVQLAATDGNIYTVLSTYKSRELVIDMITEESFWTPVSGGTGGHGAPQFASA
ncbi:MAG: Hint domain-containing protein [Epibacterium sp.]|nr:Hint domain-containing protein [Epibacterium sp.]NQX72519.1 Hint domain-containing protein [Epibacterium sp.]